jgi:hypothetical protein
MLNSDPQMSFRIPDDLRREFGAACARRGLSRSMVVRDLIRWYLAGLQPRKEWPPTWPLPKGEIVYHKVIATGEQVATADDYGYHKKTIPQKAGDAT